MRPLEPPKLVSKAGKKRLGVSLSFAGIGLVMTVAALIITSCISEDNLASEGLLMSGVALGTLGGAALALGVIIGTVFWLPKVVSLVARAVGHLGPAARIAAANSVRNPRRTTASAAALMVGVTLVSSLIVGAACAGATMNAEVSRYNPVDLRVVQPATSTAVMTKADVLNQELRNELLGQPISVPEGLTEKLRAVPGVASTTRIRMGMVGFTDLSGETWYYTAVGVEPDQFSEVIHDAELAQLMRTGAVAVNPSFASTLVFGPEGGVEGPQSGEAADLFASKHELVGVDGESATRDFVARAEYEYALPSDAVIMDVATLRELGADWLTSEVWLRLADDADVNEAMNAVQELVTEGNTANADAAEGGLMVSGDAVARVSNENMVDTILLIGLALLAVSIIVALVGVSNTLSLSVLERTREIAVLRAIGLTRRETAGTLSLEGAITGGVAGLTGVVLGCCFGLIGSVLLLSALDSMTLHLPIGRMALVLALSILTGLLASILPARRATRITPAEALSSD
jgi:putative ABC transport system permease protein